MKRLLAAASLLFASSTASAARYGLDPQNRLHVGFSLADNTLAPGAAAGLDSRLTRLLYVDVGGFFSAKDDTGREAPRTMPEVSDWFELRHGLYVAPGLRVPHRYGDGLNWDLTGRLGFGAVWSADGSADYVLKADPALLGGADLLLRYESVGVRLTGKGFLYEGFATGPRRATAVFRPQFSIEGVFQW